ncbi:hypothetical protein FRC06_008569, partial [Ceratobasidium sp. 370]
HLCISPPWLWARPSTLKPASPALLCSSSTSLAPLRSGWELLEHHSRPRSHLPFQ